MRGWTIGLWLGLVVVAGAGPAQACSGCTEWNTCQSTRLGALFCLNNDWSCLQVGKCYGPLRMDDTGAMGEVALLGVTLLDDAAVPGGTPSGVAPLAGEPAVGRGAARVATRALGGAIPDQGVLYSGTGIFETGTAAFRSPLGDGFTLRREREGFAARLTVRELAGSRPGRVLASERIGADQALVVRVPFEGRSRVLVLTAAMVSPAEADARQRAAQRVLRGDAAGKVQPLRPPFALEALEE